MLVRDKPFWGPACWNCSAGKGGRMKVCIEASCQRVTWGCSIGPMVWGSLMRCYYCPWGYKATKKAWVQFFSKRCYHRDGLQEKNWQVGADRAFLNLDSHRKLEGKITLILSLMASVQEIAKACKYYPIKWASLALEISVLRNLRKPI